MASSETTPSRLEVISRNWHSGSAARQLVDEFIELIHGLGNYATLVSGAVADQTLYDIVANS